MRTTKEQGIKIKKAILDRGYSITGFCRIHNISDRQFYAWLAGTNGYERNGIGKHFQEIADALLEDRANEIFRAIRRRKGQNHEQGRKR
jgi:transposase-like protein